MLYDYLQLSFFVIWNGFALILAGPVLAHELTVAAAVRSPESMVRNAVVAAAGSSEQLVTFHSGHIFEGSAKSALRRAVHPNDVHIGIVDDDDVIYFIQYHVEKTLCRNIVSDHDKSISHYLIINVNVGTDIFSITTNSDNS